MFSKPEMARKELYCTKSIISKSAVHRHYSTLSHIGNTLQEYIEFASNTLCHQGKPTPASKAGSELRSAMKMNIRNRRRTTQLLASCCQQVHGARTEGTRGNKLQEKYT